MGPKANYELVFYLLQAMSDTEIVRLLAAYDRDSDRHKKIYEDLAEE